MKKEQKSEIIAVRFQPEARKLIESFCLKKGTTMSAFVRDVVIDHVCDELQKSKNSA